MGTFGRSKPDPSPCRGIQVVPRSVVLKRWPICDGITIAGSQLGAAGFPQFTAFESTALLATSQVCLGSVPPRLAGVCGKAMSLPLPIQIVPVPAPVPAKVVPDPSAAPGAKCTLLMLTNVTGAIAGGGP